MSNPLETLDASTGVTGGSTCSDLEASLNYLALSHSGDGETYAEVDPAADQLLKALCNELSADKHFRDTLDRCFAQSGYKPDDEIRIVVQAMPGREAKWWASESIGHVGTLTLQQSSVMHPGTQIESSKFNTTQVHLLEKFRVVTYEVYWSGGETKTSIVWLDWSRIEEKPVET